MDKQEIDRLRSLPIEQVAQQTGLHVVRHKSLCPFHDDHHASLTFRQRNNTYHCFVCDAKGGTIDLVMHRLRKTFPEACRWLADSHGVILSEWKPAPSEAKPQRPFDASRYMHYFEHPWLSDEARRFLFTERRLNKAVVRWCRLTSWTDRQGTHWLQIPYYSPDGTLIGLQNRNLDYSSAEHKHTSTEHKQFSAELRRNLDGGFLNMDSKDNTEANEFFLNTKQRSTAEGEVNRTNRTNVEQPRFRFPYGAKCSIYNLPVLRMLKPEEPLYITEGASDCWAMLSAGHKAVAIPSATLLSPADKTLLGTLAEQKGTTFHMYPDRDAPGERLFMQLQEVLPGLQHHQLPPTCKDFAEYYLTTAING